MSFVWFARPRSEGWSASASADGKSGEEGKKGEEERRGREERAKKSADRTHVYFLNSFRLNLNGRSSRRRALRDEEEEGEEDSIRECEECAPRVRMRLRLRLEVLGGNLMDGSWSWISRGD